MDRLDRSLVDPMPTQLHREALQLNQSPRRRPWGRRCRGVRVEGRRGGWRAAGPGLGRPRRALGGDRWSVARCGAGVSVAGLCGEGEAAARCRGRRAWSSHVTCDLGPGQVRGRGRGARESFLFGGPENKQRTEAGSAARHFSSSRQVQSVDNCVYMLGDLEFVRD